nr:MAG TPA: PRKC APOPTOSIS WT1 REGULATOR PROTEIN [Caudoviricetes sp.]
MKITLPEWINAKKAYEEESNIKDIKWQLEGTKAINKRLLEDNFELLTENRQLKEENKDIKFCAMCGGIFIGALVLVDLITSISLVDLLTR